MLEEATSEIGVEHNTSINESIEVEKGEKGGLVKVPVNEDFLFDVDIEKRELAPTYWLGPIYDVRRGSWFYQEGSTLRPCDENLATQLEEGYLKVKPWRYPAPPSQRSVSQSRAKQTSSNPEDDLKPFNNTLQHTRSASSDDLLGKSKEASNTTTTPLKPQLPTYRLFGTYMNSVVTYQDATVAWLLTDDFLSRMSSTVYERFAGGGHLGGVKVVRGFSETSKSKDTKAESDSSRGDTKIKPSTTTTEIGSSIEQSASKGESEADLKKLKLEKQMSGLASPLGQQDIAAEEEEVRKRDEDEIQKDYRDADSDDQGREIEHLILVTHGVGQRLGLRVESINFVHDVNVLRKTLKSIYEASPDLQALNNEVGNLPKNCRVQVLPVVWRHLLDFPKQSLRQNRKEQDLTDADAFADDIDYPSLDDITVEGIPAVRNLITDLALDVLLYQSAYREHIAGIVQRECNRIYKLFISRNPNFHGKVSFIGHSLGSAIFFDILCRQRESEKAQTSARAKHYARRAGSIVSKQSSTNLALDFDVQDFYCLGSPIGLFQMLKGRTVAGRKSLNAMPAQSPLDRDSMDDPFLGASSSQQAAAKESHILSITVSSPKCEHLFNIFHPSDPIAYRIEPLISPAMSSLKPQPLPYIKKGIFGTPGQGFTGIGARVGQSVSGFWSNITSGVANSLLNRSLGLTNEGQSAPSIQTRVPLSMGVGTNVAGSSASGSEVLDSEKKRRATEDSITSTPGLEHPPTLIDSEIETLYAGFQKRRKSIHSDEGRDLGSSVEWQEAEARAKRLRREEAKVRALNSTGRVDFSIQE